jgi:hypothetical protein
MGSLHNRHFNCLLLVNAEARPTYILVTMSMSKLQFHSHHGQFREATTFEHVIPRGTCGAEVGLCALLQIVNPLPKFGEPSRELVSAHGTKWKQMDKEYGDFGSIRCIY